MSCPLSQATADGSVKYPELWRSPQGPASLPRRNWTSLNAITCLLRISRELAVVFRQPCGLPDREDHQIVVDALCDLLGLERAAYRLPRQ